MATRFAVASTSWNTPSTWDNGAVPVAGDTVYPNGFTVPIDIDISVASLNNNISNVYLPNMNIPKMTGNTQPSGIANASSNATISFQAFDQINSIEWYSGVNNTGWVSYDFLTNKLIKRYYFKGGNNYPTKWTFDGWDSATSQWVTLEDKTLIITNSSVGYLSPLLIHTTQYTMYRINVTAASNAGFPPQIQTFEMTESTATSYGATTGGSFTVPASLSGTRNITFSGEGIRAISTTALVLVSNLIGSTVNFNVISGGYIINTNWLNATGNFYKGFELNGTGAVNFNSNLYGSTNGNQTDSGGAIHVNGTPTITINGNIYGGTGTAAQNHFIYFKITTSNNSILNHNGDNIASGNNSTFSNIFIASNSIINTTGNLTGNLGFCINSTSTAAPTITLVGTATVTNLNSQASIILTSLSSLLTINGSIINKGNVNAILAAKIRFASTSTPYWIYQTNGASDITLAYGSALGAYPVEADVRFGTTYAASPTRTGTLRVPLPQYVSQGVLTDNTVGTAYINAADVWNVLTSNITTSGSIGERLKTASTVQTNGDQLAAYIV